MDTYRAVKASFDRCGESDGFYDTFYDTFLAKSPDIPALFAHTDFTKQKLLLKATIAIMVRHRIDDERARQVLAQVAQTHNRSRQNINPELYRLWLDSLCETVRQHDPEFSPALEAQWRERMQEGIDVIVAHY
jgi:hemoglobin-like flavoprotein